MTKRKASASLLTDEEERGIQAGIAQDPDNPEITAEQFAEMRPASEVLPPALYRALTRRGRPPVENKAVQVTLRVPPAVLDGYKSGGPGWQTRMNDVLAAGLKSRPRGAALPSLVGEVRGKELSATIVKRDSNTGRYAVGRAGGTKPKNKPKSA